VLNDEVIPGDKRDPKQGCMRPLIKYLAIHVCRRHCIQVRGTVHRAPNAACEDHMRTRLLSLIALLALPAALSAQILRAPRRPSTPAPAPLPPTAGPVARTLELHHSRWSVDAYSLFSNVRVPTGAGTASYASFGGGTHGGYRIGDRFTGTVDLTTSQFGSPINSSTAEVGTRFMPMPFSTEIRPFFDVRATYMWLMDNSAFASQQLGGADYQVTRYGRGLGAIAGGGFEYPLTNSLALSTEVSALRGHMTAYRSDNPTTIPTGTGYWLTSYRLTLGLKFSATRLAPLTQKPH
jgi:hypothetical protein